MTGPSGTNGPFLFYSYSHKDDKFREAMETSLALLRNNNILTSWSDHEILPGQLIPTEIRNAMNSADILVFLFSQNFISSSECMKEWDRATQLAEEENKLLFRIPIILSPCAWLDVLGEDSVKALPDDGKPVSSFRDHSAAWQQVYQGIKSVVENINNSFSPRALFIETIDRTEFIFKQTAMLSDIFVTPSLRQHQLLAGTKADLRDNYIELKQLLQNTRSLIYGDDVSGKTSLARHLFLTGCRDETRERRPILIDLKNISGLSNEQIVESCYHTQYVGDYNIWRSTGSNIAIMDNLSPERKHMHFLEFAMERFATLVVVVSTDLYNSYFFDDSRFVDFNAAKIQPLNHHQQETLIRKTLLLSQGRRPIEDGYVDQVENKINSIIISNRIVPRYPFYVLSILQSEEQFMPDMPLTSFGHCYYILIVAHLIKSGVSRKDEDLNACFNFLERLAFDIYSHKHDKINQQIDLDTFVTSYRKQYFIAGSLVNRLRHTEFGILDKQGAFRQSYMYYYFLAKFLASNREEHYRTIQSLCMDNHLEDNHLIVLFLIHHTSDDAIIDEILVDCLNVLSELEEATLGKEDTSKFEEASAAIPGNILSRKSVEAERHQVREVRDLQEWNGDTQGFNGDEVKEGQLRDLFKMFRSIDVLGQVLRNKYGTLQKDKIEDVIETLVDGGLRSVNAVLGSQDRIDEAAVYLLEKYPELEDSEARRLLSSFLFLWTLANLALVTKAINVPPIIEAVNVLVKRKDNAAYDLVGYFTGLEAGEKLTMEHVRDVKRLIRSHNDTFFRKAVSLVTQGYMNTHSSGVSVEQAMCSALGIRYVYRKRPDAD